MANSTAGSTSSPDGLSHQDIAKERERQAFQQENERLRKELAKARGIIESQNLELENLRSKIGQEATTAHQPASPTSVADHENSVCSSTGTSEHTSCSVVFIEGKTIPEIHALPSSSEADLQTPPRHGRALAGSDPPSNIHFEQETQEDGSHLNAKVSRRVSSITMPEAMSPLLVQGTAIRDEKPVIASFESEGHIASTSATVTTDDTGNYNTSATPRTSAKKRLERRPTPLPSTPERDMATTRHSSDADDERTTSSSDETESPINGRSSRCRFEAIRPLFSVKEDSDQIESAQPKTEYSLKADVGPPLSSSSIKAAAAGSSDARAHSEVTQKASNTASSVFNAMQRRPKQQQPPKFLTRSPLPPGKANRKSPPDAPGLAPPKRTESPPPKTTVLDVSTSRRPTPTLEVQSRELQDAAGERGVYTGSMDSKTLVPDGFGTMVYKRRGRVYTGDWEQGLYHGYGKFSNSHGDVYDGPYRQGRKEGPEDATMNFHDGRRFKGRFHADKMREGILQFIDGSSYEGLLENNKRNGFGLYCFQNGDQYEGQWKNDLMHGRGRMEWKSDGAWYNGDWKFGIQHGMGTEADAHGRIIHQGRFHQGKPIRHAEPVYENEI